MTGEMTEQTQATLNKSGCATPNCGHDHDTLYFHGNCHPTATIEVTYEKATGLLYMACGRCGKPVCMVKVAAE